MAHTTLAERFWAKVDKGDDCWIWKGAMTTPGYGRVIRNRRSRMAHRVAWELTHGRPVPEGMQICHSCDVRPCVRPDHLFVGTVRDNMRDKTRKGRGRNGFGPYGKDRCSAGHLYAEHGHVDSKGRRLCRTCRKANMRRWRENNRERAREFGRLDYAKHTERRRADARARYYAKKER